MSYHSSVTGEITITPPLSWAEYSQLDRFRDGSATENTWLRVLLDQEEIETSEGTLVRKTGTSIVALHSGLLNHAERGVRDDLAELRALIAEIQRDTEPSMLDGYLLRQGERQGDVQRYWVDQTAKTVRTETAELRWADGSKVEV